MKLKTRLIIAFCIIILLPIALALAALFGFYTLQSRIVRQNYGYDTEDDAYVFFSNTLQLMNRYTESDYTEILNLSKTDPGRLESEDYLEEENEKLQQKSSFLIFCKDGHVVYNGYPEESSLDDEAWEDTLPSYGEAGENATAKAGYFIDGDTQSLIKQVDFICTDDSEGSVFIITSSESILPEIRTMLIEMGVAVVLILALTAGVMTVWIYRGTITPIRKLQTATKNIKEGNLDFTIDYDEEDEMGDLCRNFEEMRKRLKESTEEKMKTEQENKALISNIAHDLKTPITAVKGYSEGILDGVADTPEKRDRYLRTIFSKANEMDRLLNELTLYAQIDTNRIPYNFNKILVSEYFADCVDEIGLDLETKNIGLSYFNYADEQTIIIADPEQLMRVINNIINNAVKYMDDRKGQINIRIKDVGDFIQVEIEDNGKGIAAQDLPYIFDRFYRTDASRNSSTGGSGIGLSIVKKIIEDHGGKIWATSKLNTGTIMYFVIRKYQENIQDRTVQ
ncbi:MAG: HAMP domain-containing histidine kinase [Clostridiales bacterium]|nr:HAMP domain-containing histidine kinase [Clostridiales bacterium]